jgi:TRAP-type mannitol/chloroaromatic compound transport system permease small subunit
MINFIRRYVRIVDAINKTIGRIVMYGIFAMMGLLLYSSISKSFFTPSLWTLEMAQFSMAAYYMLGGAYSMQLGAHVRMDLLYGRWSVRGRAFVDTLTSACLVTYLGFLLYGAFSSTGYALQYSETSYSAWSPYMAPIKITMTLGIILMVLQTISIFFKDLAKFRGWDLQLVNETQEEAL